MFEVESVPSRDNKMLLICCFFFLGIMFKTNGERTIGCKVSQSDLLSIRNSLQIKVSIRIYSYLNVREGNERDVVRIYWYLSALCRFNGTHQSAYIRIYSQ